MLLNPGSCNMHLTEYYSNIHEILHLPLRTKIQIFTIFGNISRASNTTFQSQEVTTSNNSPIVLELV